MLLRKMVQGLAVALIFATTMGPVSHALIPCEGPLWSLAKGLLWGLLWGLAIGIDSGLEAGIGSVVGLGLGAGLFWEPFDGLVVCLFAALFVALGVGLFSLLLGWNLGEGVFWGLGVSIGGILFILLNAGWPALIGGLAGGGLGNYLRRRLVPDTLKSSPTFL